MSFYCYYNNIEYRDNLVKISWNIVIMFFCYRTGLKSSECSRYDELVAKLKGWDTLCPFVATEVADEFGITGTDGVIS